MNCRPQSSSSSPTRRPWATLGLGLVLFVIGTVTPGFTAQGSTQDPTPQPALEAIVQFASLSYSSPSSKGFDVHAKDLSRIQLVESGVGGCDLLELFFVNGDYVLTRLDNLTFFKAGENLPMQKVSVRRVKREKMAFPLVN